MLFKKICNAPHPANENPHSEERFCSRSEDHKGSHWVVIDGVKYFW